MVLVVPDSATRPARDTTWLVSKVPAPPEQPPNCVPLGTEV